MKKSFISDILALSFGALLTLSFAPFHIWPLAIISPATLLLVLLSASALRSFWRGWLFGIGFFATSIYWVFISMHTYGQANEFFAGLATAALVLFIAVIFIAIPSYCFTKFFTKNNVFKIIIVFPILWVIFEWLRSWLFTGFPWLLLGYSQMDSPLRGLAPILSVYGVSLATCLNSSLIVFCYKAQRKKISIIISIILLTLLWMGGYLLTKMYWTKPIGNPIQISMIQGNIPQSVKWSSEQFTKTLKIYTRLTQKNWNSQIIIWPEAAITLTQIQVQPFLNQMSTLAKQHDSAIILGIPIAIKNHYYNGMLVLGNGKGMYLKRHLVPFGEYLPFRSFFKFFSRYVQIPMSDFSAGKLKQEKFIAHQVLLAPYICYEIIYPQEVRKTLDDAKAIVVISDDSWFGHSIANAQHLQMTQMRALETGREILLSTNNGMTAIINSKGQVIKQLPPYKRAVLTGKLQGYTGKTPFIALGMTKKVAR